MPIQLKDSFVLINKRGKKFFLQLKESEEWHHLGSMGALSTSFFLDKEYGVPFQIEGSKVVALPPTLQDRLLTIKRKAQIITSKDIAPILFYCDIKKGQKVLEIGTGSGAMTLALASSVSPDGKVVSYDLRKDFSSFARKNLERNGLEHLVEFVVGDVNKEKGEEEFDRCVVDIPEPWNILEAIHRLLKTGGILAIYLPTANQVIGTLEAMKELPFFEVRVIEVTEREYKVNERAFRPENLQIVHTGYLIFARKIKEKM